MATPEPIRDPILERPLPSSPDTERAILGAIILDNTLIAQAVELLKPADFYVPSHRRVFMAMIALFERIAASGAIITQFAFNRPADKQSFPIRNRIVAGMTLGTVVVEANLTSGALITANFATEYGRQVFAVPGRIDSPRSKGCHELIKKGAKLCESAEDILTEFEYLFPSSNRPATPNETGVLPALELSPNEQKVYATLDHEELSIDDVIQKSGLPSSAVSVALLGLEMKRLVKQLPGKMFVKNH